MKIAKPSKVLIINGLMVIGMIVLTTLTLQLHVSLNKSSDSSKPVMDAFATHVVMRSYDKLGLLHSLTKSPYTKHLSNKTSLFTEPNIVTYTKTGQPWYITSDQGKSLDGNNKVFLWGHVKMHQPKSEYQEATHLYTQRITIYPGKDLATSDQKVKLVRPDEIVTGVGMIAHFKPNTVKLLSHTKAVFFAQHKKSQPHVDGRSGVPATKS